MIQYQSLIVQNIDSMFYNHNSAMLVIDALTGKIVASNLAAEKFYGYSLNEFQKINIDKINMLIKDEIKSKMHAALFREKSYFNFKHKLKNGMIKDVEVHSSPVSDNQGNQLLLSIIHEKVAFNSWDLAAQLDDRFKVLVYLLDNQIGDFSIGSINKIAEQTGISVSRVSSFLKLLEGKKVIKRQGNGLYKINLESMDRP